MAAHEHDFHGLWYHLGPYGRQDVHLHPCSRCSTELVGEGRECKGPQQLHVRKRLLVGSVWARLESEGTPLEAAAC